MHALTGLTLLFAGLAVAHPARHRGSWKNGRPSASQTADLEDSVPTATAIVPVASATSISTGTASSAVPAAAPSASASTGNTAGGLWQPASGASWQIVLSEKINAASTLDPDVDIYDIDMFGNDASTISQLHTKGKKVICYFSAGSYEPYRDDSSAFTSADMGLTMDGWPDEKWLDIKSSNVRDIMTKRIQLAASKGCDAVDPDNVDGFGNENGLGLTAEDTREYMVFLADTAAASGMSIGLKNALDLIPTLIDTVHFAVNEQCHEYSECDHFMPFAKANKPVFNIEYPESAPSVASSTVNSLCAGISGASSGALSTVIKKMELDGWVQFCDTSVATTSTT